MTLGDGIFLIPAASGRLSTYRGPVQPFQIWLAPLVLLLHIQSYFHSRRTLNVMPTRVESSRPVYTLLTLLRTIQNHLETFRVIQNQLQPYRIIQSYLESTTIIEVRLMIQDASISFQMTLDHAASLPDLKGFYCRISHGST